MSTAVTTIQNNLPAFTHTLGSPDKCWVWQGSCAGAGYGVLSFDKRSHYVHRVAYRLFVGNLRPGQVVCHRCDNPPCFNPSHLFAGSQAENVADMMAKGRANHTGATSPSLKFSQETVAKIRADFALGIPPYELRKTYGISHAHLWRITRRHMRTKR